MSHHKKTTFATQKKSGEIQQVMMQQEVVHRLLTHEELSRYNEISADFGKEYLKNQIDIPRELVIDGKRTQTNVFIAVFISAFVVLSFFGSIFWLLYKEQYQYAVYLLGSGIVSTILAFLGKSLMNPYKKN